jgi:hypothetical protein
VLRAGQSGSGRRTADAFTPVTAQLRRISVEVNFELLFIGYAKGNKDHGIDSPLSGQV